MMTRRSLTSSTLLLTLGLLAVLSAIVGCVKQEAPGNQPAIVQTNNARTEAKPEPVVPAPNSEFESWLDENPFNQSMRLMWIDTSNILGNSYYPDIADRDSLRYAADSLARRSERFAAHFRAMRDHNRDSYAAAKLGNWDLAAEQYELTHQDCGNCHVEFWTLRARGFASETLQSWKNSNTVFVDVPLVDQEFSSPGSVRLTMVKLRAALDQAGAAVNNKDLDAFRDATAKLHNFANKQLLIWDGITNQAEAIAKLARDNKLDEVGGHYIKLTKYCSDCHADSSDGRGLDPLPWE